MPIRIRVVATALTVALGSVGPACLKRHSSDDVTVAGMIDSAKRMRDGKQWTATNLNVNTDGSYCYGDAEPNCRRYGRLYTWESAHRGCQSLGDGWRLPTNDEWRQLADRYGGVRDDSDDSGRAAYAALVIGGDSGFNALLGGGRSAEDGQYARQEAHGFYWTASENEPVSAWFYNFGRGGLSLNRHPDGNKQMALSVRCIRSL
ncbi:MAG: FISUMP domain-containing protein [Vicinamibacterales bacterium]